MQNQKKYNWETTYSEYEDISVYLWSHACKYHLTHPHLVEIVLLTFYIYCDLWHERLYFWSQNLRQSSYAHHLDRYHFLH